MNNEKSKLLEEERYRRIYGGGNREETFQNSVRYKLLKEKMRSGERIPREDFLFVKGIDLRQNTIRSRIRHRSFRDNVNGNFVGIKSSTSRQTPF